MKLSIRDWFSVVVVVGLGLAWWLDHRRLATALERSERVIPMLRAQHDHLKFHVDVLTERMEYDRAHWQAVRDRIDNETWERVLTVAKEVTAEKTASGENPYRTQPHDLD